MEIDRDNEAYCNFKVSTYTPTSSRKHRLLVAELKTALSEWVIANVQPGISLPCNQWRWTHVLSLKSKPWCNHHPCLLETLVTKRLLISALSLIVAIRINSIFSLLFRFVRAHWQFHWLLNGDQLKYFLDQHILLAHLAWEKAITKWKRKYFENLITSVNDVNNYLIAKL